MSARSLSRSFSGIALMSLVLVAQAFPVVASDMMERPPAPKLGTNSNDADLCGFGTAKRYVGARDAAQIRAAIASSVDHRRIRWIKPGTAVTQDYRPDRLNVILSEAGRVLTVRCG